MKNALLNQSERHFFLFSYFFNHNFVRQNRTRELLILVQLELLDEGDMNWVGAATCSTGDIEIYQGQTTPLPNGIPTYTVQVLNVCVSGGCSISNIHLSCGWFSSARLINPNLFRRICYDDCLVKDGNAMGPGEIISFQYANSFPFPLSVSSVAC